MRIVFFASHLLHHRVLLPVVCELTKRGHDITVQTNRAAWRGLPSCQMALKPTMVTGINEASLDWVADLISYHCVWKKAKERIKFARYFVPEEYDCAVSTTKDMARLESLRRPINGYTSGVAIGYQHLPAVVVLGRAMERNRYPTEMPDAFRIGSPFESRHQFRNLYSGNTVYPCGFPHLDHVAAGPKVDSNEVLIIEHGAGRKMPFRNDDWLGRILSDIRDCGLKPVIAKHALRGLFAPRYTSAVETVSSWWPRAARVKLILTTGSSCMYEMWSIGLRNAFVVGYEGGGRAEAFRMFPDIYLAHREQLRAVLRCPELQQPRDAVTRKVIEGFQKLHDGKGAKTAADIIEEVAK